MIAIFQGRRWRIVSQSADGVQLRPLADGDGHLLAVGHGHRDLILHPTTEDLRIADAFERGEIGAFEYPDGTTYPPNREIPRRPRGDRTRIH